jgi:hypothetical protein
MSKPNANLADGLTPDDAIETTAVTVADTAALATTQSENTALGPVAHHGKVYSINPGDIDIPWLNIVQKSSDIKGELGSLMFDKRTTLALAETDLRVIPLAPRKGWKEDHSYESDEISRFAWNEEDRDKLAADSSVGLLECAEIIFLIPAPTLAAGEELDEAVYMFPFAGQNYALGRLYVQKDGYRNTFKRVNTFNLVNAATGAVHTERVWHLRTELMEKGKHKFFIPRLTVTTEPTNKELLDFILTLG